MDNKGRPTPSPEENIYPSIEELIRRGLEYYGIPAPRIEDDKILDEDNQLIAIIERDDKTNVKIFTFVRTGQVFRVKDF